jgi:hypothetical protein
MFVIVKIGITFIRIINKKVKQSRYRPGAARRVPGS